MSPKQFDEIFEKHRSKLVEIFGDDVINTKFFIRRNERSLNGTFVYVIASRRAIDAYFYAEDKLGQVMAYPVLRDNAKIFTSQPQAVKWMEGLQ